MRDFVKAATVGMGMCVLLFGCAFSIARWSCTHAARLPQKLDPSNPRQEKLFCGPVSLSTALQRLGVNIDFRELAGQCDVTARGVTLRELTRVAQGIQDVKSRTRRLNWEGLRRFDGVAVLFVRGNHFVAADPREAPPDGLESGATVRIYEEAKPAQWMTREELEKVWQGETLAIARRRSATPRTGGPHIVWDQCLLDNGILTPNTVTRYAFPFRNTGDSDLTIDSVKKSCGCATYTLTSERLAPGQTGVLEAKVDLRGKKGYFLNRLLVQTNDRTHPLSILRVAGGVPKTRVLSVRRISLGDLPQGGKVAQEFYAGDPGFRGLTIRDVSFVPTDGLDIAGHLTCSTTYDLLGEDAPRVARRSGYHGKPEDYVIRLALEAGEKCPVGPFQGEVNVVVVADDAVSTHTVMIKGEVVQDVHPVPGVALITLDGEGAGSATVELRSHAGRDFQVVEAWADSGTPVRIEPPGRVSAPSPKFVLSALMPGVVAGAPPIESAAFFKLHNGMVIRVPVSIVRPP